MEEKKAKIQKTCGACYIIAKIVMFVTILSCVWTVIFGIAALVNHQMIKDIVQYIDINVLNEVNEFYTYKFYEQVMFITLVILQQACVSSILYFLMKFLEKLKEDGIPFRMENALKIRNMAIILLVYSLIPTMKSDACNLTSDLNIGGKNIFFAIILFLLAKIFEYGCDLQQESEDTL